MATAFSFSAFLTTFTSTFVAMDIIGVLPIYLTLTQALGAVEKKKIVNQSMGVALGVAVLFMIAGTAVFRHLGISISDFKVAGGLILLLISVTDLINGPSNALRTSGSTGIVPLAVPLISGPAIFTTLVFQLSTVGYLVTFLSLVSNYLIAWLLLRHSDRITHVIGKDGTTVLSKIAHLLLAAIAVAMMRSGFTEIFELWHKSH